MKRLSLIVALVFYCSVLPAFPTTSASGTVIGDLVVKSFPWVDVQAGYGTLVYGSGASSAQQTANAATMQAAIDYGASVGRRVMLADNVYFNSPLTIYSSASKPFIVDFKDATLYYTATDNTNAFIFPADTTPRTLIGGRLYGPAYTVSCSYTGPSQATYGTGSGVAFTGTTTTDANVDIDLISGFGGHGVYANISGFTFNRVRIKKTSKVNTGFWVSGNSNEVDVGYVSEVNTGVKLGDTGKGILTLRLVGKAIEAASYGISMLGDQILDELDINVRYMETIDNTAIISTAATVKAPLFRNMRISVPAGKMLLDVSSGNMKWATFIGNAWSVSGGATTGFAAGTLNYPTWINNEIYAGRANMGNYPTILNDDSTSVIAAGGWELWHPASIGPPAGSVTAAAGAYSIPFTFTGNGSILERNAWFYRTVAGGTPGTWEYLWPTFLVKPASASAFGKPGMTSVGTDNTFCWNKPGTDNTWLCVTGTAP